MITAIVAVADNNLIGSNNDLPWPRISEDMNWFKSLTTGNVVVMGRNTWESLGDYKPLPNRINVVVSSDEADGADLTITENTLVNIKNLETEYPEKEIFIIGGARLYETTESIIDKVQMTRIRNYYEGDTFLNTDLLLQHSVVERSETMVTKKDRLSIEFNTYRKLKR